jgi:hypothetical protein
MLDVTYASSFLSIEMLPTHSYTENIQLINISQDLIPDLIVMRSSCCLTTQQQLQKSKQVRSFKYRWSNMASAASSNFGTAILAFSNSHHDHTTKPLFLGQFIPKQISNYDSPKSNGLGLTNSSRESLTHTDLWILPRSQKVCEKEQ